jgi:hypothetical protein
VEIRVMAKDAVLVTENTNMERANMSSLYKARSGDEVFLNCKLFPTIRKVRRSARCQDPKKN